MRNNPMIMVQIEAWYPNKEQDLVRYLRSILKRFDFNGTEHVRDNYCSWDILSYAEAKVWVSIRDFYEEYTSFKIKVKGIPVNSLDNFIMLYNELIGSNNDELEDDFIPYECIMSDNNPDLYPSFIGKFRGPLTTCIVDDESDEMTTHVPTDDDYWDNMYEKMLHFVSSDMFEMKGIPSPKQWSNSIHAPIIESTHGVVFDCGWEKTWGAYSSETLEDS